MMDMDDLFDTLERAQRPSIDRKPWMDTKVMARVTIETLSRVIDECVASGLYALDIETTGLDNRVYSGRTIEQIVGICLSPDGVHGYYLPMRHRDHEDKCIPITMVEAEMRRLIESPSVAIFHNGKFDHEFLQFCGGTLGTWDVASKWEDTLILKYLQDAKAKAKGLKHLAKTELQPSHEMIELDELFTTEELAKYGKDFSVLDPTWEPAIWYACSDAICTYLLYHKLHGPAVLPTESGLGSQLNVYNMEKACVPATRWMERNQIPISLSKVEELIRVGQGEWFPALKDVFDSCSQVLGRNVAPGYFRLLSEPGPFHFDPNDITTGIMDRVQAARDEAEKQQMDPTETGENGKTRVQTIPKSVPKLAPKPGVKVSGVEEVAFPRVYDVLMPDQLGLLLRELGVEGLQPTEKGGQIKTSKDVLDEVLDEAGDDFPFLAKVKRFREVAKALASNLMPIYEVIRDPAKCPDRGDIRRVRINFQAWGTDTGRFSTPQDRESRGWTGKTNWNLHSIPSTRENKGDHDEGRPECMKRIREIIAVEPGRYVVAIDFSGQELRVIANLSKESLWTTEFFRCAGCGHQFDRGGETPPPPVAPPPFCPTCGSDKIGDLHALTAINVFGEHIKNDKKLFKDKRNTSKGINFGLSYGGGPNAIVRTTGCSKDEGYRIKRQFDNTYKTLQAWWKKQHEFARLHGAVVTAFGRRCPLPDIYSEMSGFRSKAERNAVNAPIQGTGADLMKYSMALIYKEFRDRGWLDRAKMILTIHDELVFDVEGAILDEMIDVATEIMLRKTTSRLNWRVPLTADVEVGQDWTVPWNITHIRYGHEELPPELQGLIQVGAHNREAPQPQPMPNQAPNQAQFESQQAPPEVATPEPTTQPPTQPPETEAPEAFEALAPVPETPAPPAPTVTAPQPSVAAKALAARPAIGEPFTLRLDRESLSVLVANRLAETIYECRGRGQNLLRVVMADTGEPLWDGEDVYVDAVEFEVLFSRRGLPS